MKIIIKKNLTIDIFHGTIYLTDLKEKNNGCEQLLSKTDWK